MLPSRSSAGLVTGCRFSAIVTATFTSCPLLTWPFVATTTGPEVAPSGTRAITKSSELTRIEPSTSPNCTRGRRNSGGRKPLPTMRISPPGRAAAGRTESIRGLPLTFFLPRTRSEIPILYIPQQFSAQPAKMNQKPCHHQGIQACANIVEHDAGSRRDTFQMAQRRRLHDVERPKKYKTRQQRFPTERQGNQCNQLAGYFVNHHKGGVRAAASSGHPC